MRPPLCTFAVLLCVSTSAYAHDGNDQGRSRVVEERIGSLDNAGFTVAHSINNHDQVVGSAKNAAGVQVAFLWSRRSGFRTLAEHAAASDINNRGEVVGSTTICFDEDEEICQTSGWVWTARHGLRDLGNFVPFSINDRGDMAGYCAFSHVFDACVMRGGALTVGAADTQLYGINRRGDAVGAEFGTPEALLWRDDGALVDLGTGVARAINNRGAIAGWRFDGVRSTATVWTRRGAASPALSGNSLALSIDTRGDLVGVNEHGAFFWNPKSGVLLNLGSQAANQFTSAEAINDKGRVVGYTNGPGGVQMIIWRVRADMLSTDTRD